MSWTVKADKDLLEELEEYGYTSPIVLDATGLLHIGVALDELGYDVSPRGLDVSIKDNVLEIKKKSKSILNHRIDEWTMHYK